MIMSALDLLYTGIMCAGDIEALSNSQDTMMIVFKTELGLNSLVTNYTVNLPNITMEAEKEQKEGSKCSNLPSFKILTVIFLVLEVAKFVLTLFNVFIKNKSRNII